MVLRAAFAAGLCAATVLGQGSLTLPTSHVLREGSSSTNVPFGRSTPTRVQCCYDPLLFPGPVTITALALRADGGGALAQKLVDCEIRMSTMPGGLLALGADFAANRGSNETIVLPRQMVTLPGQSAAATPSPFLPWLALAQPFSFDPAGGSLLVEFVVFGQPPGAYSIDATYVCDSPAVAFGPAACAQPGASPLRVESATAQVIWGRPWVVRILDAPAGALVTLVLGNQESGPWSGFVLPQDLAILGAPGCYLSLDVVGSQFSIAAGDGTAAFPFVIPNAPSVVGEWLRFQAGAINPQANSLGVVTSQAQKVQVCGWEPVGRLWATGLAATTGTRELGVAPVLQILVQ